MSDEPDDDFFDDYERAEAAVNAFLTPERMDLILNWILMAAALRPEVDLGPLPCDPD